MELGKDLDAHEVGFIEDQDGLLFFAGDFGEETSEGLGQEGDGEATRLYLEGEQDLFEQFEDRSGVSGDRNDPVFRGVQRRGGMAKGGGFPRANLTGNNTNSAQLKGILESVCEGLEARQRVKVLDLDILQEGFSLKAKEVLIASHHRRFSFRRVFPPDRI
jgi:hypothetical protein